MLGKCSVGRHRPDAGMVVLGGSTTPVNLHGAISTPGIIGEVDGFDDASEVDNKEAAVRTSTIDGERDGDVDVNASGKDGTNKANDGMEIRGICNASNETHSPQTNTKKAFNTNACMNNHINHNHMSARTTMHMPHSTSSSRTQSPHTLPIHLTPCLPVN